MRTEPVSCAWESWSSGAEATDCAPPIRRPKSNRTPTTARTGPAYLPILNRRGGRLPVSTQPGDGSQSSKFRAIEKNDCEVRSGCDWRPLMRVAAAADDCHDADAARADTTLRRRLGVLPPDTRGRGRGARRARDTL